MRGLTSWITYQDIPVLVAINAQGVYIIDDIQCVSQFCLKNCILSQLFSNYYIPSQFVKPLYIVSCLTNNDNKVHTYVLLELFLVKVRSIFPLVIIEPFVY